jgi:hypothetical protein
MKLPKINSSFFKFFLLALVLTQGLVFVTSRAAFEKASTLNGELVLEKQSFMLGELVPLQVYLPGYNNLAKVYFNIGQVDTESLLQIQAVNDGEGVWTADSLWDTASFAQGQYLVTATAISLDEAGKWDKTLNLKEVPVDLAGVLVVAAVADENPLGANPVAEESNSSVDEAVETDLLAEFVSPATGASIGVDELSVDISLNIATSTANLGVTLYDIDGNLVAEKALTVLVTDNKRWQASFDIADKLSGDYYLVAWQDQQQNYISTPLLFAISHSSQEPSSLEQDSSKYQLSLEDPIDNAVITSDTLVMKLKTNFAAESLGVLLTKLDDPSIGDEFIFSKVDGVNWDYSATLSADLVNGEYVLSAIAVDANSVIFEKSFKLVLDRVDFTPPPVPNVLIEDMATTSSSSPSAIELDEEFAFTTTSIDLVQNNSAQSFEPLCLAEDIYEAVACEDYLNRTVVDLLCQKQQIFDPSLCLQYLAETYASDVMCANYDDVQCRDILTNDYLNRLVVKKINRNKIDDVFQSYFDKTLTVGNLQTRLGSQDLKTELAIADLEQNIFLAKAESRAILFGEDNLITTNAAVMFLDTDSDFLPDDLEKYYGSDPLNPNTDGDSYLDGLEVKNNYSPIGEGALETTKTPLEMILASGQNIEQPKTSLNKTVSAWQLNVNDVAVSELVNLSGQASPNTWLNIFIYSDLPLVLSVLSDESGSWSYPVSTALSIGEHQAYVVEYDAQGQIARQSAVASFAVAEETEEEETGVINNILPEKMAETKSWFGAWVYYLAGGIVFIVVAAMVFVWRRKRQQNQG